jgi:putative acetyltransferase
MNALQDGIFPVEPQDVDRVLEVWEESVRATHTFVALSDIDIFRPLVRSSLEQLPALCVRDSTGAAAGFMIVVDGKVEALFLHPDWRGQGAGRRLLQHAIDHLGATELDVNEQNPQAIGFYERMGFEVVGRSDTDGNGKPYPILYMRLRGTSTNGKDQQMSSKLINPETISTPIGYSHIADTSGSRTVYISGQIALDKQGNVVGVNDMGAQAEQIFQNLSAALGAVGATFEDVVKLTYYVVDMAQFQAVRDVRARYLNQQHPPASTAVGVTALVRPEFLLEIEAIVVLDN